MTTQSGRPLTCPNGHAMDEGYFNCPCCGAYRPSAHDPRAVFEDGVVVGMRPQRQPEHDDALLWLGGFDEEGS